jgi:orotate phosphoribosyltransferase
MTPESLSLADLTNASLHLVRTYLLNLFAQFAYQEGDFTLSSGLGSSYYINGKKVALTAPGALAIGRLLLSELPPGAIAVAGLTLGADPLVSAVSVVSAYEHQPVDALIVRKEAKGHGTQAYIEGPELPVGSLVVVLEDVVTTGRSALLAVERLRAVGYQVKDIIALIDRQQGGAEFYHSQHLNFKALFTIAEVQAVAQGIAPH